MSLLSRLAEKSWLTPGAEGFDEPADYRPAAGGSFWGMKSRAAPGTL